MGTTKIKLVTPVILLAGAFALAACGGDDEDTGTAAADSGATTTASVEAFCAKADELNALDSTFSNLAPNDIEGAKQAFQTALDKLQEVDAVAPEEAKADVDAVVSTFSEINDEIQGIGDGTELQQLGATLNSQVLDLQQNVANLQAYTRQNCN